MSDRLTSLIEQCKSTLSLDSRELRKIDFEIVRIFGLSDRYKLPEDKPELYWSESLKFGVPNFTTSLDSLKILKRLLGECTHWGVLTKKEGGYSAFVTVWYKDTSSSRMFTASHDTSDTLAFCIAILLGLIEHQTKDKVHE